MKECLNFNFVTDIQIRSIDALPPIWKVLFFERLYHIGGWKARNPLQILTPRMVNIIKCG
jgi:hypothetical protein